jgi:branched-chain amino acid transport system ATP-binding protein
MTALLEACQLVAGYHNHPVINGIDLKVDAGQVIALCGSVGAGKTTTVLTLAGEIKPMSGMVKLFGNRVTGPLHQRARQGLSLVAEERMIFTQLSVKGNLNVGRCDRRMVLDLFPELERLLGRRAGLLSGGEQQMLTLGRALARRPKVLVIDELSMGLGPLVVTRLLKAVRDAADTGVGILLVEQHINQLLTIADHVYVLNRGRIALQGSPSEVGTRLKDTYFESESTPAGGS